jgi:replication initiation protein RepC
MQRPVLAGDCVKAAYDLTAYLGISHSLWAEACAVLGHQAAAVCVVLIDQAMQRPDNPVRKPNGYFRSMIHKAERGELHLHKSVFGILKRGRGLHDA